MANPELPREADATALQPEAPLVAPEDAVIFRFISQTIKGAVEAGSTSIEANLGDGKSFSIRYMNGQSVLEEHTYPAFMQRAFQNAMQDLSASASPNPVQFDLDDRIALVTYTESKLNLVLQIG